MARKTLGYVELEWVCPNCGVKNPGGQRTCSSCGAPQPQDVAFRQAEHAQLINAEAAGSAAAAVQAGADIHCAFCNARNPATATVCLQCGADLAEGTRRQAGQVIGAFQGGEVQNKPCPHCGTPNPETAQTCAKCGGSLAGGATTLPQAETTPTKAGPAKRTNPLLIVLAVGLVILLCAAAIWLFNFSTETKASSAFVQSANWKRVIVVEGIRPVEHEDWKDVIPAEAEIGECHDQARDVRKEPAPKSTEVCGTPYTLDTGTGKGEVVQDCEYHVYDTFCTYTTQEWTAVDRAVARGDSLSPTWPEPSLSADQRLGDREEEYTILFAVGGKTYPYRTSDAELFSLAKTGSQWTLNINNFDKVISAAPAK